MTRVMVSPLISMCVGLLLLASSVSAQEVVFSRRVYAKAGHTYQQLWIWSASDGSLTPLTDSPRDHSTPVCSRDGQEVFYVSNSLTLGSSVWRVDRGTGVEQQLAESRTSIGLTLIGFGQNDELLILGAPIIESLPRTLGRPRGAAIVSPIPDAQEATLSPDGLRLAVKPTRDHAFLTDTGTGTLKVPLSECDSVRHLSWSPDGARLACTAGRDVLVLDAGTLSVKDRIPFPEHDSLGQPYLTAPEHPAWSPDGRTLLVGTYGGSSTVPQLDYFLVDVTVKTWTRAMTGHDAVWLPHRNAIIYTTPRDLVPLGASQRPAVWSEQLALFDVATLKERRLTSGLSNNVQPALCTSGLQR
jgi:Tol biopolymer transport system component